MKNYDYEEKRCPLRAGICDKARNFPHPAGHIKRKRVFISYSTTMPKETKILKTIKNCVKEAGFEPVSFEVGQQGAQFWCTNICPEIRACSFIIAEMSYWQDDSSIENSIFPKSCDTPRISPNISMEAGMAYALGKPLIVIIKEENKNLLRGILPRKDPILLPKIPNPYTFKRELNKHIQGIIKAESKEK